MIKDVLLNCSKSKERKKMAHTHTQPIIFVIILTLFLSLFPTVSFATQDVEGTPEITASSYILMDYETGQILYGKDIDSQMFPASTTKIMTAILAIELSGGDLAQTVTVAKESIQGISKEDSQIALDQGEEISLENLLYAALLPSANDACNVIAQLFGGDDWLTEFPKMMTEKAKEIGAVNTNFTNTNGLHDENHYTTAHDMALIMSYALKNDTFRKFIATESHNIPATNKKKERDYINSTVELIKPKSKYYYANALGGKTGYTPEAGNTCVSAAKKNGITLIAVVMKSSSTNSRFTDSVNLFDYGFNNFLKVTIPSENLPRENIEISDGTNINGYASVFSESGISFLLNKKHTLTDISITSDIPANFASEEECKANVTIALNQESGYMYKTIGTYPLSVMTSMLNNPTPLTAVEEASKEQTQSSGGANVIKIIIICLLVLLLIALLALAGFYFYSNMVRKKRARERRLERLKTRSIDPLDQKQEEQTQNIPAENEIYDEIFMPKGQDKLTARCV